MTTEVTTIFALLALGGFGWWFYQRTAAVTRKREEEEHEFERHDHARALKIAEAQADLQRWKNGPY